ITMIACFVAASTTARAQQQPRIRTLTYEPQQKEWIEQPPPPAGTADGDLYAIKVQIHDGHYRRALSAIKRFVNKYGKEDPAYPEALIAKAEALIGLKDYDKAHVVLQAYLGEFGGMTLTAEALRLEFVIAEAYLSGVKRKVWLIFRLSGEDLAYQILDEISSDYPESPLAELAVKTKADHLFKVGEHALAELEYARVLKDYPRSRYHQFSLGRSAESALASFAGVEYDEAALVEAEERYNDYRLRYRSQADREGVGLILDSIHEMRGEKDFLIGQYYERTDHPGSAVFYYQGVRKGFPETIAATKATSRLELLGVLEPVAAVAP
ncbi:MAG: outer membrane protein assembly factor BamD, partial [Planctomycetota bacterium]